MCASTAAFLRSFSLRGLRLLDEGMVAVERKVVVPVV
jgi:hypothetical protein